ncbi:hypothetical protein GOP47_0028142 [Adiantum capillus-veneris]|nr:hypothetical protein GOP47_0028142 [Adiantum capillus-veneris]
MAAHHRYAFLGGQADHGGRPPKTFAAAAQYEQQLWNPRKPVIWVLMACPLMLIVFLVLSPIFSSNSLISLGAQEGSETGNEPSQTALHGISPLTQDHINVMSPQDADVNLILMLQPSSISLLEVATYGEENQNCIKLGRPDLRFLYWRWKPYGGELPLFDGKAFLKIVVGKTLAFIGDSIARNNFQSVLCHLAQVEIPECISDDGVHGNVHMYFRSYNFAWAPFLIKGVEEAEGFAQHIAKLDLDVFDESWAPSVHNYDYISLTLSPDHWQNAAWDQGGNCTQKAPFESKSHALDGLSQFIYNMQLEEFGKTVQRRSEYAFKLKILDALHAASLRPDAHPGPYGHFHSSVENDCLHWCLPGAVDAWSAMLLHMLKHL